MNPDRIPNLEEALEALRHQDYTKRMQAAKDLGQLRDPRGVPGLLVALDDADEWVATEAAEALGQIGHPSAVPALLEVLKAQSWRTWWESLRQDVDQAENRSHAILASAAVAHSIGEMRSAAAEALGQIGDPSAVPGLIEALRDRHITGNPQTFAAALRQIGTPEALAALQAAEARET